MMERTVTRWDFYWGGKQIYLFMIWQEDWYAGEVIYGRVLFRLLNVHRLKERYHDYLAWANSPHRFPGARP